CSGDRSSQQKQCKPWQAGREHEEQSLHVCEGAPSAGRGVLERRVPGATTFGRAARTCRRLYSKRSSRAHMKAAPLLSFAMLLLFSGSVWSASPELGVGQLNHRMFTATEGAPSDISGIAQTTDGTIWIGGRAGLTRFDGVRFVPYPEPG